MKKRKRATGQDQATKSAERIGESLARMVNRLEGLDRDRERAYQQLLALQRRMNERVAWLGRAIRKKTGAASASDIRFDEVAPKPSDTVAKPRVRRAVTSPETSRKKDSARRCGVCGTPGHNARGHASWQASQGK